MFLEEVLWRCLWAQAFPTLLPILLGNSGIESWEEQLAWQSIWKSSGEPTLAKTNEPWGYGEMKPFSLQSVLRYLQEREEVFCRKDTTFVDLGSGRGMIVLAALTFFPFQRGVGIEMDENLFSDGIQSYQAWQRNSLVDSSSSSIRPIDIEWILGDFCDHRDWTTWRNPCIIFCHATLFAEELMERLTYWCSSCSRGTVFIMVSRPLQHSSIITLKILNLEMSWGMADVFLQKKS